MPECWTTAGLLDYIERVDSTMADRAFAFVLGAGASRQSGIPTGRELVDQWLHFLWRRHSVRQNVTIDSWATADHVGIPGFDYSLRERFYPEIFERTFRGHSDEGYAFLESIILGKEPSLGYSILAQVLARGPHSIVITTNFDNLVGDALALYTRTYPFICGHESLTEFVRPRMRRPLIAKIHRDLLLGPRNDPAEISALAAGWDRVLRDLFRHYTPIVIGYGGNDGTLMGLLEGLEPGQINGRMVWCFRDNDGLPDERIRQVVERHRGILVPILGFDEFMVQLGERLGLGLLTDEIMRVAAQRAEKYADQFAAITRSFQLPTETRETTAAEAVRRAIESTVTRAQDEWGWYLKAESETTLNAKEAVLRRGLNEYPTSGILHKELAEVHWIRGDRTEAMRLYRLALEHGPHTYALLNDFGMFLSQDPNHRPAAREMLQRAIREHPSRQNAYAHLGAVELLAGQLADATRLAERAWQLSSAKCSRTAAKAALIIGLCRRLRGVGDTDALGRLKRIIERGFDRGIWPMGLADLLAEPTDKLDDADKELYTGICFALDQGLIPTSLSNHPRWLTTEAIKLTLRWGGSDAGEEDLADDTQVPVDDIVNAVT